MFLFLLKLNFFWHSQALKSEGKKMFRFENVFQICSNSTLGDGTRFFQKLELGN